MVFISEKQQSVLDDFNQVMKHLRELLHSKGRLSSRNEALDELSKLMYAHLHSERGISRHEILLDGIAEGEAAKNLERYINNVLRSTMPANLSSEMNIDEFLLKMKIPNDEFAIELIRTFEKLPKEQLNHEGRYIGVDVINNLFGQFLADSFTNEKELGQYLTPTEAVKFMVNLAIDYLSEEDIKLLSDPKTCKNFGLILDPSCGVGSFLVEIVKILEQRFIAESSFNISAWLHEILSKVIVGVDKSERMIRLATTNISMFGYNASQIHLANSLAKSGTEGHIMSSFNNRAKIILTNPPFGAEFDRVDTQYYKIGKSVKSKINSEILFLERYLDWLAPGGQLLAIVPDSILTNKGLYEKLRNYMSVKADILNVISLPDQTFAAAGTNTKTSILHMRKKQGSIEGIPATGISVCNDIGYVVKRLGSLRTKKIHSKGDLPLIYESIKQRVDNESVKWRTGVSQASRWDAQFHMYDTLNGNASELVKVRDVATLANDRFNPSHYKGTKFKYIEIGGIYSFENSIKSAFIDSDNAPSRARKRVKNGDVVISTVRPDQKNIAVVNYTLDNAVCTTGIAVLRPHSINSLLLAKLLSSDYVTEQLNRQTAGVAFPAIDELCILDLILPIKIKEVDSLSAKAEIVMQMRTSYEENHNSLLDSINSEIEYWKCSLK